MTIILHTVPPNSLLANVAVSGPPVAGSEFSMDCIIVENITGLTNMPTAMWLVVEESMVDLSTNDDITITTLRNDTVAVATVTFDPLRSSHGEGGELYRCVGSLMTAAVTLHAVTPGLIEVDIAETLTVQSKSKKKSLNLFNSSYIHPLFHTVPAPTVSLAITSSGPLIAGGAEDVTLTCSALLDLTVVDTQQDILYSFTWQDRAGVEIMSGDRVIISQSSSTSTLSSLSLSPLMNMDTDFTCTVAVSHPFNTLLPSDFAMASLTLEAEGA